MSPRRVALPCLFLALSCLSCDRLILDFEGETTLASEEAGLGGDTSAPPDPPPTPELVVNTVFDLSRDNLGERACADGGEAVDYRVSGFAAASLTLTAPPWPGCLSPGDEVLLIELQTGSASVDRVGRHELLRIEKTTGNLVTLVSAPTQSYGVGTIPSWDAEDHVIVLQRVPNFSRVQVSEGAALTAASWESGGSGVLALRAVGDVTIDGQVTMTGAGFLGGAAQPEALGNGKQGGSITGPGATGPTSNQGGGGGGLGDQTTNGCAQDGNAGGGGAHLHDGEDAVVLDICEGAGRGRGGRAYATPGRIFLGSGGGGGGMDNVTVDNPPGAPGGNGGGIVWLLAQSIGGSGVIESQGEAGVGDPQDVECETGPSQTACYDHSGPGGGGAGGTVRLSAPRVSGVDIDVSGGRGGNGFDTAGGNGGQGSAGVIESAAP